MQKRSSGLHARAAAGGPALTTTANPAPKKDMNKKMNARNAEAQTEVRGDVEGTRRGGALTIVSACFVSMLPTVAAVAILAVSRRLLPQTVSTEDRS